MNNIEKVNLLLEIEDKIDIEGYNIKGINTYLIYRLIIFSVLSGENNNGRSVANNNIVLWKKALRKLLTVFVNNLQYLNYKFYSCTNKKEKCDILFFSSVWYRRVRIGKNHYNPYIDPLIELLEENGLKTKIFEYSGNHDGFKKNNNYNSYTSQSSTLIPQIKSLFKLNLSGDEISRIDNNVKQLNYYLPGNNLLDKNLLTKRISLLFYLIEEYKIILKAYKPNYLLIVCYYNYDGFAMIEAAKMLGIETFDVQHGIQGKYHFAYGITNIKNINSDLKPAGYVVNTDNDRNNLIEYQDVKEDDVIVANNHIYRSFLEVKRRHTNIDEHISVLKRKLHYNIVLITLQYGIGIDEKLKRILTSTSNKNICWWIRLHPNMKTYEINNVISFINNYKLENVQIEEPTNLPLELIFPYVDLQITHYSTTALDGLDYGIKTILINPVAKQYYSNELNECQYIEYYGDIDMLINYLSSLRKEIIDSYSTYDNSYIDNNYNLNTLVGRFRN